MICHSRSSCHKHPWPFPRWSRRRFPSFRFLILLALFLGSLGLFVSLGEQGWNEDIHAADVSYIYDEVGRLKAVVDPAGNTALYTYDAVGNLLDITRHSSGQVAIIQFVPAQGPEGTSVTISGIGFSFTPSQNTLSFNGTVASVISATTTEIVTTVPVGATNGTLTVTSPLGSDTSSQSFTVTTSSGAPTITSINPTLATSSTAITIEGTNFDPTPGNSKVYFNVTKDIGASVSTNSISTAVPSSATSGPLKVSTLQGMALGPDLFIPPPTYTVNQVESTRRITPGGGSTSVSIATQNNIGLMVFDGNGIAGQRVSLEVSQAGSSGVTLYDPKGATLGLAYTSAFGKTFLEPQLLAYSGSYTLMFKSLSASSITNALLTLYNVPADVSSPIQASGPSVQVTTTVPGQNANLPFNGTAGQRVSLKVTQAELSQVLMFNPDGTQLAYGTTSAFGSSFLDPQTLGTSGSYKILLDPLGTEVVTNATLSLYDVPPDVTGPIVPGGAPVQVTTTTPGQKASLTFSGTAGQRVSLNVTQGGSSLIRLNKPDGSQLAVTSTSAFGAGFLDTQILPVTGTYTVLLDPLTDGTVSGATLTLYDVPPDITGSIAVNGGGISIPITTPGQNGLLTFAGEANVEVTVNVTGNTMSNVTVQLKRANGTILTSNISGAATFSLIPQSLPATETYSIVVNPSQTVTGTLTLSVSSPDVTPPVVSAISSTRVTGTEANITWTTNEAADSQVEYGKTTAYGSMFPLAPALVTSHSVMLTGLSEYTVYHYGVKSRDAAGNLSISGDGTFTTGSIIHGSQRDFNGDGKADLIWRDSTTGTVSIWLMNGTTVASSGTLSGAGLNWALEGMGDTNGDGKADLIWRNLSTGSTAIWLMNGLTIASSGFPGGQGLTWAIKEVGDVNGDGKADLIWRDSTTGTVSIWLMNGLTVASSGSPGGAGLNWALKGMGDTDGNGKADLIWRDLSTGSTAIWLMNGLTIASSGFPGGVGLNWVLY